MAAPIAFSLYFTDNPVVIVPCSAREAMFLSSRSSILRLRLMALKSRRCKAGPDQKAFCPEAFLSVVADKLSHTAVQFINVSCRVLPSFCKGTLDATGTDYLFVCLFTRSNSSSNSFTRQVFVSSVASQIGQTTKFEKNSIYASVLPLLVHQFFLIAPPRD